MAQVFQYDGDSFVGNYAITNAVTVSSGDLVYLSSSKISLADADTGPQQALGFAVLDGEMGGNTSRVGDSDGTKFASIYKRGIVKTSVSSQAAGDRLYLSATAGGYTRTQTTTAGAFAQCVGVAKDADYAYIDVQPTIVKYQAAATSTAVLG